MEHKIIILADDDMNKTNKHKYNIKKLTGSDILFRRELVKIPFKPLYKSIFFQNEIPQEPVINRSKKSYKIFKSVFRDDNGGEICNELSEYDIVLELFEQKQNILNFSDLEYLVIYDKENNCFYLKNTTSSQIYRCDYFDIEMIYANLYKSDIYSQNTIKVKSICKSNGKIKLDFETNIDFLTDLKLLNIKIFKIFIENNFDIIDTIIGLKI